MTSSGPNYYLTKDSITKYHHNEFRTSVYEFWDDTVQSVPLTHMPHLKNVGPPPYLLQNFSNNKFIIEGLFIPLSNHITLPIQK